jgi:hypothetical protein
MECTLKSLEVQGKGGDRMAEFNTVLYAKIMAIRIYLKDKRKISMCTRYLKMLTRECN